MLIYCSSDDIALNRGPTELIDQLGAVMRTSDMLLMILVNFVDMIIRVLFDIHELTFTFSLWRLIELYQWSLTVEYHIPLDDQQQKGLLCVDIYGD